MRHNATADPSTGVTIGEATRRSGVKAPTIRYYEQIGLLGRPTRTANNRRTFCAADLRRLGFIRHARELGFEIEAIRTLLTLQDDATQSCSTADAIAKARLAEVEQRLRGLEALRIELVQMIDGCAKGHVGQCHVIEVLADHGLCRHDQH